MFDDHGVLCVKEESTRDEKEASAGGERKCPRIQEAVRHEQRPGSEVLVRRGRVRVLGRRRSSSNNNNSRGSRSTTGDGRSSSKGAWCPAYCPPSRRYCIPPSTGRKLPEPGPRWSRQGRHRGTRASRSRARTAATAQSAQGQPVVPAAPRLLARAAGTGSGSIRRSTGRSAWRPRVRCLRRSLSTRRRGGRRRSEGPCQRRLSVASSGWQPV